MRILSVLLLFLAACQETTDPTQDLTNLDPSPATLLNFSGEEGEIITLTEGQAMTLKYQRMYPNQTRAFFIGADRLHQLLNQESALGVRFYLGLNGEQQYQLVGAGVDDTGTDLLNQTIVHATTSCSSNCNAASPLWHDDAQGSDGIAVNTKDGAYISIDQAQMFTHFYQKLFPKSQKAFYFGQEVLHELLDEAEEPGLWFYMGINEIEELELLPTVEFDVSSARFAEVGPAKVADRSWPCPPVCYEYSLLVANE
ncbi:hypothetical protein [Tunicatimonas pelagia]|uniref:hypothetical protein n=1 Tax=Tunicatimonas pelagia TaxID=931531 RepID=UPI002665E4AA|nr:hypothetical protein [Tunicatimonas pelagia]WKN44584.1 hypothetical protein P0M28_06360 [Tunicatimonas pelagia]